MRPARSMRWPACVLIAAMLAVADARRHRYGGLAAPEKHSSRRSTTADDGPPPPQVSAAFLQELVASFKANDDADSLILPSSMSKEERRLVHIYAARNNLGHKSIGRGTEQRFLRLSKDEAWVARRKRRYLEAEMSDMPELDAKRNSKPLMSESTWLLALGAYYVFI